MGTQPREGYVRTATGVVPRNHPSALAAASAGVNPSLIVQRRRGWEKVHEEGRCRMCQRPSSVRPLTRHHIVPLSYFRRRPKVVSLRHSDANIVGLCEPCHRLVEKPGVDHARVELRRVLSSTEIAFAIQVAGQQWLDARYPSGKKRAVAPQQILPTSEAVVFPFDQAEARRRAYKAEARRVWREGLR